MQNSLRLVVISVVVLAINQSIYAQTAGVGIGTTTPHISAQLEIDSPDKGLLIPRMYGSGN